MKKWIYISSLVFLIACGEEKKEGNGEIVNEVSDEKKVETHSGDTNSSKENLLVEDVKDKVELPGGTIIQFYKHGKGDLLVKGDMVNVNYKTFLPGGKQIDGNEILNRPLSYFIGINMSIQGWDEAFLHLRAGDKIKLHLPSSKAYGKKGFGTMVPPDTDLDFEIEVISKEKPNKTASGLKYYYLVKKEDGKPTKAGNKVDIHYYGWVFKTGKLFDTSHNGGKTYQFTVDAGEEILCWEEIVKIMREGEKVLMVAPANLAYAEKGVPELVPPNSKLVYIIEMMKVK